MAAYAKMSNDPELEEEARRIRAQAKRRMGELLLLIERPSTGGRPRKNVPGARDVTTRKSVIEKAGIGKTAAQEAIKIASIPQAEFDAKVESDDPPSIVDLVQMAEPPPKHNAEVDDMALSTRMTFGMKII